MTWETTYCDKEIAPNCEGHQGWEAITDCVVQACWDHPDETTGNVDGFGSFVALVIQEKDETTADGILVKAGTYLTIRTNDQGFIYPTEHETAQAAQDEFDSWDQAYGTYLAGEDHSDALSGAYMVSSGRTGA